MRDSLQGLPNAAMLLERLGLCCLLFLAWQAISRAEVIDRIVAVVGQHAITASEVELQLRLEALFNREPLEITDEKRRRALQRLIAVRVIQSEAIMAGFLSTSEQDVQLRLQQARRQGYANGLGFEQALQEYDLREQDVADFWRQVIGYERFKDFRFKTGLEISAEAVAAYYEKNVVAEFNKEGQGAAPPLAEIYDQVEQAVIEERANEMLDEWLKETRPQTRIVILEEQEPPKNENTAPDAAAAESQAPR
ncbi:MAG: hypothetical protein WD733_17750 [Bryobacterales bacterium]